jgi:hypothetical protein
MWNGSSIVVEDIAILQRIFHGQIDSSLLRVAASEASDSEEGVA